MLQPAGIQEEENVKENSFEIMFGLYKPQIEIGFPQ